MLAINCLMAMQHNSLLYILMYDLNAKINEHRVYPKNGDILKTVHRGPCNSMKIYGKPG